MDSDGQPFAQFPGATLVNGVYWSQDRQWWWNGTTWCPAAAGSGFAAVKPFKSPDSKGLALIVCLAVTVVVDLLFAISLSHNLSYVHQIQNGTLTDPVSSVQASDNLDATLGISTVIMLLVTAIAYFVWIYRAYSNLPALGATQLPRTPKWTFWGYIIPFVNLVMPYQLMRETWATGKTTDPNTKEARRKQKTWPVIPLWWASWLLANLISVVGIESGSTNTLDGLALVRQTTIASEVVNIFAALCMITIVRSIGRTQQTKHATRLAAHAQGVPAIATP